MSSLRKQRAARAREARVMCHLDAGPGQTRFPPLAPVFFPFRTLCGRAYQGGVGRPLWPGASGQPGCREQPARLSSPLAQAACAAPACPGCTSSGLRPTCQAGTCGVQCGSKGSRRVAPPAKFHCSQQCWAPCSAWIALAVTALKGGRPATHRFSPPRCVPARARKPPTKLTPPSSHPLALRPACSRRSRRQPQWESPLRYSNASAGM